MKQKAITTKERFQFSNRKFYYGKNIFSPQTFSNRFVNIGKH